DRVLATWRLTGQARVARIAGVSALASVDRDRVFTNGDLTDVCVLRPGGQCVAEYPLFAGWMFGAGLRTPTARRGVITVVSGLGWQRAMDRRGRRPDEV